MPSVTVPLVIVVAGSTTAVGAKGASLSSDGDGFAFFGCGSGPSVDTIALMRTALLPSVGSTTGERTEASSSPSMASGIRTTT